jgi:hypothetical protein
MARGDPKIDVHAKMEAFDQLPAKIRAALNYSPDKYIGLHRWMARYVKSAGVDKAAKAIRAGKVPNTVKVNADCN